MPDDMLQDSEALAALARKLLIVAIIGVVACLVLVAVDYRLKKGIVTEADQWRREVRASGNHQQPRQQRQPPRDDGGGHQPGPVRHSPAGDGLGGNTAPAPDTDPPVAAPIVPPGADWARPPHRGAIDG